MQHPRKLIRLLFGFALIALCAATTAHADRDDRFRGPPHGPIFRDPHWVLDSRFHHDHYYPRVGYALSVLPPGYLSVLYHDRHFFFNAGVWFVQEGPSYVVVAPPAGVVIPALPPAFTTIWIGGTPYYYANGIYYAPTSGGYVTVAPPQGYEDASTTPPPLDPTAATARSMPPANDLLFVYPKKKQSDAKIASDRVQCTKWATGQTGYDPEHAAVDDTRRGDYLRAVSSCLEDRGYTVK